MECPSKCCALRLEAEFARRRDEFCVITAPYAVEHLISQGTVTVRRGGKMLDETLEVYSLKTWNTMPQSYIAMVKGLARFVTQCTLAYSRASCTIPYASVQY